MNRRKGQSSRWSKDDGTLSLDAAADSAGSKLGMSKEQAIEVFTKNSEQALKTCKEQALSGE